MITNARQSFIAARLNFALSFGLALWSSAPAAVAAIVIEQPGGTGFLPPDAQVLPSNTTEVLGDLLPAVGGFPANTVDMYRFNLPISFFFFARTQPGAFQIADPQLFLFGGSGRGVLWNNDRSLAPSDTAAELPLREYAAGTYFLAISWFAVDPVDVAGQYLFDTLGSNSGGPIGPGGANPVAGWLDTGAPVIWDDTRYEIDLRLLPIPEPSTFTLVLMAASTLLAAYRRARP